MEPFYYLPFIFFNFILLMSVFLFEVRRRRIVRMLDEGYMFGVMEAGQTRIISVIPPNQQNSFPQAIIPIRY